MTKTKTKTKTKSLTKTKATFPMSGWQADMEYAIELPNFFENPSWQDIDVLPPPGPDETRDEIEKLLKMQENLAERQLRRPEIEQEADAFDDPLPFTRILGIGPGGGRASTYVLMQAMTALGKYVAVHFKYRFMRARPSQLEPRLRPLLDVPGHPAYPSGHAVQMFLIAQAMATVVQNHELSVELLARAQRIAVNREWAGLHYASDTEAGRQIAFDVFPLVTQAFRGTLENAAHEWM
jgi:hypothetical protein